MKTSLFVLFVLFIFSVASYTQTGDSSFEFGKPSDLKGLTKVYVETMGDLKEHDQIVTRLAKAKVQNLEIVEDVENAEIILLFGGDSFTSVTGATSNAVGTSVNTTVNRVTLLAGEGRVFVAGRDGKKPRLVMRVQNEQETRLEKRPVTKFVNEFVKIYMKVNGLEKGN
jgi:hypothetical protein